MSERVLAKMAYRAEPEGVIAVVEAPARELPRGGTLYLVAVGIEKPGNLGAMARTAEAAGADALVVAEARADVWNPNAIRASTGAVFTLPVVEATLDDVSGLGVELVAAAVDAPTLLHRRRPRAPDRDRRRRRGRGPRRALARRRRPQPSRSRSRPAAPTASTPRPPPRSSSSRRCASVVSRDDVLRARDRSSSATSSARRCSRRAPLGARLKCELFQRTGSFKPRGALNRLASADGRGEAARRDRDLGRQPRAGGRLRRRARTASTRSS